MNQEQPPAQPQAAPTAPIQVAPAPDASLSKTVMAIIGGVLTVLLATGIIGMIVTYSKVNLLQSKIDAFQALKVEISEAETRGKEANAEIKTTLQDHEDRLRELERPEQ